jgi:hypothetical protein
MELPPNLATVTGINLFGSLLMLRITPYIKHSNLILLFFDLAMNKCYVNEEM